MLEQVLNFQFWKIARETKPRKTSNRTAMGASSYGKLKMHFWIGSSAVVIVIVENPSADLGNANTEQKGLLAFFSWVGLLGSSDLARRQQLKKKWLALRWSFGEFLWLNYSANWGLNALILSRFMTGILQKPKAVDTNGWTQMNTATNRKENSCSDLFVLLSIRTLLKSAKLQTLLYHSHSAPRLEPTSSNMTAQPSRCS